MVWLGDSALGDNLASVGHVCDEIRDLVNPSEATLQEEDIGVSPVVWIAGEVERWSELGWKCGWMDGVVRWIGGEVV